MQSSPAISEHNHNMTGKLLRWNPDPRRSSLFVLFDLSGKRIALEKTTYPILVLEVLPAKDGWEYPSLKILLHNGLIGLLHDCGVGTNKALHLASWLRVRASWKTLSASCFGGRRATHSKRTHLPCLKGHSHHPKQPCSFKQPTCSLFWPLSG